jgi:lincosamide nucleotidyltransferase A/C/D/E
MTEADVAEVLDALDHAGVTAWLDGGWGVDALVGAQTRQHEDLDLAIDATQLDRACLALAELGFEPDQLARPGLPARVVLRDGRARQVDVHPLTLDRAGNGWQPLGDGAWGLYPADGLSGSGSVGGRQVRCLTAALQLSFHLGYPPRDTDRHDLSLLARHFGVPLPPAEPATPAC